MKTLDDKAEIIILKLISESPSISKAIEFIKHGVEGTRQRYTPCLR